MKDTVKIAMVLASLALGASGVNAAPVRHVPDPWVAPIHLDSNAVPAKQYFEEAQHDGE